MNDEQKNSGFDPAELRRKINMAAAVGPRNGAKYVEGIDHVKRRAIETLTTTVLELTQRRMPGVEPWAPARVHKLANETAGNAYDGIVSYVNAVIDGWEAEVPGPVATQAQPQVSGPTQGNSAMGSGETRGRRDARDLEEQIIAGRAAEQTPSIERQLIEQVQRRHRELVTALNDLYQLKVRVMRMAAEFDRC